MKSFILVFIILTTFSVAAKSSPQPQNSENLKTEAAYDIKGNCDCTNKSLHSEADPEGYVKAALSGTGEASETKDTQGEQ